jgi:hypothetical protein
MNALSPVKLLPRSGIVLQPELFQLFERIAHIYQVVVKHL